MSLIVDTQGGHGRCWFLSRSLNHDAAIPHIHAQWHEGFVCGFVSYMPLEFLCKFERWKG